MVNHLHCCWLGTPPCKSWFSTTSAAHSAELKLSCCSNPLLWPLLLSLNPLKVSNTPIKLNLQHLCFQRVIPWIFPFPSRRHPLCQVHFISNCPKTAKKANSNDELLVISYTKSRAPNCQHHRHHNDVVGHFLIGANWRNVRREKSHFLDSPPLPPMPSPVPPLGCAFTFTFIFSILHLHLISILQ